MWLGEAVANWTGIPLEGQYQWPPFLTDAYWGSPGAVFVTGDNPWKADDDTDIEYVYLHALANKAAGTAPDVPIALTGEEIRSAWVTHINRFIWVSNAEARARMTRGVKPPSTGLGSTNFHRLAIDAQLTTELFGALAPGMPERALELAALPTQTTAHGHAAHVAQTYVLWYALATQVPSELTPVQRGEWLVRSSRRLIPDTSKVADALDFILADYLANPDKNDWESTRDKVYARFQYPRVLNYQYRGWTESTINFCSGVIAILYGQGDYQRTVQIGVLCGWDCDNAPATLGGLFGLMLGYDELAAQFPGVNFSDRFWISRTRDALPDYLPMDAGAEDTFTLMAQRALPVIDRVVIEAGGRVTQTGGEGGQGEWLLPPVAAFDAEPIGKPNHAAVFNALVRESLQSNNVTRSATGGVSASSNTTNAAPPWAYPWSYGVGSTYAFGWLCNALEPDASGREESDYARTFYSSQNPSGGWPAQTAQTFTLTYSPPVNVRIVRLIEGNHWPASGTYSDANVPGGGGWFETPASNPAAPPVLVELLTSGGLWTPVPAQTAQNEPFDANVPFQVIEWTLPATVHNVSGLRVSGWPGGTAPAGPFVTIAELDTLSALPSAAPVRTFDVNVDAQSDVEDLYAMWADGSWTLPRSVADLDHDGAVGERDAEYLEWFVRWNESGGTPIR